MGSDGSRQTSGKEMTVREEAGRRNRGRGEESKKVVFLAKYSTYQFALADRRREIRWLLLLAIDLSASTPRSSVGRDHSDGLTKVAFGGLQSSTTIVSTTLIVLELDHRESSPNEEGSMHGLASSGTGEPGMFSLIDLYLDN